ncbi:TPA: DUF2812 domain-containing protein [Streptococcus agalactiae]
MIKFKLFFKSTEKEEEWIDKVQKSGYTFTGINSFLPAFYYFKRDKEKDKMSIKMDFKKYISKDDYANYITLFEDSGWKRISGSRWGGLHYFQKIKPETSSEIFSDQESKSAMAMSYYKYTCEHAFFSLFYFFLLIRTTSITIFDPKSWYLTQGLWEMQGKIFWLAFLFETPFALLRILPMFYFLISGIYYITRAVKPKEIIN